MLSIIVRSAADTLFFRSFNAEQRFGFNGFVSATARNNKFDTVHLKNVPSQNLCDFD